MQTVRRWAAVAFDRPVQGQPGQANSAKTLSAAAHLPLDQLLDLYAEIFFQLSEGRELQARKILDGERRKFAIELANNKPKRRGKASRTNRGRPRKSDCTRNTEVEDSKSLKELEASESEHGCDTGETASASGQTEAIGIDAQASETPFQTLNEYTSEEEKGPFALLGSDDGPSSIDVQALQHTAVVMSSGETRNDAQTQIRSATPTIVESPHTVCEDTNENLRSDDRRASPINNSFERRTGTDASLGTAETSLDSGNERKTRVGGRKRKFQDNEPLQRKVTRSSAKVERVLAQAQARESPSSNQPADEQRSRDEGSPTKSTKRRSSVHDSGTDLVRRKKKKTRGTTQNRDDNEGPLGDRATLDEQPLPHQNGPGKSSSEARGVYRMGKQDQCSMPACIEAGTDITLNASACKDAAVAHTTANDRLYMQAIDRVEQIALNVQPTEHREVELLPMDFTTQHIPIGDSVNTDIAPFFHGSAIDMKEPRECRYHAMSRKGFLILAFHS